MTNDIEYFGLWRGWGAATASHPAPGLRYFTGPWQEIRHWAQPSGTSERAPAQTCPPICRAVGLNAD